MRPDPSSTARTKVKRLPEKSQPDRAVLEAILDAGLMGHVAVVDDGQPFVIPIAYARIGDEVVFHGSSASRAFRALATGAPTCFTVTLLDGLVLARSAFESSMNYRSVMVLGSARVLEGSAKDDALRVISDHLLPGRWDSIRPPSAQELKATTVLGLSLEECSVKVSSGGPDDVPADLDDPHYRSVWSGVVPIIESFTDPVPDELSLEAPVPEYIRSWSRR